MENIDELISKLAQDTATVKRAPHPFMLSIEWMVVAVFYLAVSLMISGARHDLLPKLHEPWFAAEIAALVGIFISTSLSAALLSYPDLHQKRRIAFGACRGICAVRAGDVLRLARRQSARPAASAQFRMHAEHHAAFAVAGGMDFLCDEEIRQHPYSLGRRHRITFRVQHRRAVAEAI